MLHTSIRQANAQPCHKPYPPQTNAEIIDAAGRALFDLGRVFNRLPRRDLATSDTGPDADLGMIVLAQTIGGIPSAEGPITVGTVAARLALDPSTASRLVARGVERGLLHRRASTSDGRAVALSLTDAGERLAAAAGRYQRSIFDAATVDWSPSDRATFARLFVEFATAVMAMTVTAQEHP